MLRVESYLLFYPYDNSQMYPFANEQPGDSLWELGLDFTVSPGKTGFRGAEEHARLKGKERFKIFGLLVDADGPTDLGDAVLAERQEGRRHHLPVLFEAHQEARWRSARSTSAYAVQGTKLEVRGKNVKATAIAHTITFDDPEKKKRNARGLRSRACSLQASRADRSTRASPSSRTPSGTSSSSKAKGALALIEQSGRREQRDSSRRRKSSMSPRGSQPTGTRCWRSRRSAPMISGRRRPSPRCCFD